VLLVKEKGKFIPNNVEDFVGGINVLFSGE